MIDLIQKIHLGEINPKKARTIFDLYIRDFHKGKTTLPWECEFSFSKYEATAYLHGATFQDLVYVRYVGWPTICDVCKKPINYREYGWKFRHRDKESPCLVHIECLP